MAGLYIHIPYCHSKCSYCDFFSTPNQKDLHAYVSALIAEAYLRREEIAEPYTTMYIGGGTPSILPTDELGRLVRELKNDGMTEITIEANPEDVTPQWADAIAEMGTTRVSMCFQSFVDSELSSIGRRHSANSSILAVKHLRNVGIEEISGDLIYGLPNQTIDSWRYSLEQILSLELPHMSAYSLSYEPGTKLYAQLLTGKIEEAEDDLVAEMYNMLISGLKESGYEHYEISNFAKKRHRSQHNSSYWHDVPYLGIGVAAHSFDGKLRRSNPRNIKAYINAISAGMPYYEIEEETEAERYNDYVITALRTKEGINLKEMSKNYNVSQLLKDAAGHISTKKLIHTGDYIAFDEKAWLVSDAVLRDLIIV